MQDEFFTQQEVAEIFHISARTLERKRVDGAGPPFVKFGRRVLYRRSALEAWIADRSYNVTLAKSRYVAEQLSARLGTVMIPIDYDVLNQAVITVLSDLLNEYPPCNQIQDHQSGTLNHQGLR